MIAIRPQGLILWFTGFSGVGKTTLARRMKAHYPALAPSGDESERRLAKFVRVLAG